MLRRVCERKIICFSARLECVSIHQQRGLKTRLLRRVSRRGSPGLGWTTPRSGHSAGCTAAGRMARPPRLMPLFLLLAARSPCVSPLAAPRVSHMSRPAALLSTVVALATR